MNLGSRHRIGFSAWLAMSCLLILTVWVPASVADDGPECAEGEPEDSSAIPVWVQPDVRSQGVWIWVGVGDIGGWSYVGACLIPDK